MVARQFIGFIFSGGVATAANLVIYVLLLELIPYLLAGAVGYLSGTGVSFLLNKSFVFQKRSPKKFLAQKYFLVDLIALFSQMILLYAFVQTGLHEIIANLAGIAIVTVAKFLVIRGLVF